jgi:sugar lactone lactonase YvrE
VSSVDEGQSWELVADDGWHFPTSVALSPDGTVYLAESGPPFAGAPEGGRVWRIDGDGGRTLLADGLRAQVNGLHLHDGALFVSEGGHPGRISRLRTRDRIT